MALVSTLVTSEKPTTLSGRVINSVGTNVKSDEIVVNKKADELKAQIVKSYTNINKYFNEIAKEYRACADKSVKGDSICASLKKVAKKCEDQGRYCLNRQKNINEFYKKAVSEKYTKELEIAVESLTNRITDLENRLTALEGNNVQ